jgi:hypothetical protein
MLTGIVRKTAIALILSLMLAANIGVSHAQIVPITARVDRTTISTDELLTLTVTILGEINVPLPVLPNIEGAQIVRRSTASQITITNGKATAEFNFAYLLQPLREGPLTIDPITILINGIKHETDPIQVSITPGTGVLGGTTSPQTPASQSLNSQAYFVRTEVDNNAPYQGEQVTFTSRFYEARAVGNRQWYRPPDFTGFWNSQQGDQRTYREIIAGRRYSVTESTALIFPTLAGDVLIEPAMINVSTRFRTSSSQYASESILMNVKPLPPGAPSSFTGAVGSYEISASVDLTNISSSDPATLTIKLSGEGNIDTLPEPIWPDMPGWRVFENRAETVSFVTNDKVGGIRTYERVLIPEVSGVLNIPSIEYAYFDPAQERYLTIFTDPIAVNVTLDTSVTANNFKNIPSTPNISLVESDIRHIKSAPATLDAKRTPLTSQQLYWALWALPALLIFASAGWGFKKRLQQGRQYVDQATIARDIAMTAINVARESNSDPFTASGEVLTAYLSTRLDRPASGLTHNDISALLTEADISSGLVQEVDALLNLIQEGRYGPTQSGATSEPIFDQTEQIIDELEWEFEQ